jgi:hypothetical protein
MTMARELDTFEWGDGAGGRRPKYDWGRWLNGDIWEIRRGEDYEVPTENMRVNLHAKAEQHRRKVRTRKVPKQSDPEYGQWEGLVFQFYIPDDDETGVPAEDQAAA